RPTGRRGTGRAVPAVRRGALRHRYRRRRRRWAHLLIWQGDEKQGDEDMALTLEETRAAARERQALCADVKGLLVERLTLDIDPALIGDDQPLFGRGLELDSIDTLELAMAVEDRFGVVITGDATESLLS